MMGSAGKLAVSGAVAGLLAAMTVASFTHRQAPMATPPFSEQPQLPVRVRRDREHCRAITMPETECEAAWDAERRHFFGSGEP